MSAEWQWQAEAKRLWMQTRMLSMMKHGLSGGRQGLSKKQAVKSFLASQIALDFSQPTAVLYKPHWQATAKLSLKDFLKGEGLPKRER